MNATRTKTKKKKRDQFQLTMDEHYMKLDDIVLAKAVRTSDTQWYFETYQTIEEMMQHTEFFDARDIDTKTWTLNLISPKKHLIKLPSSDTESILCNTAPTISKTAALELLQPPDLHINTAIHNLQPVIFDTGASHAITGDKSDFLPNTYREVHSLKLGGMAAGATINGVGDIAWTFGCNNGDQLSILTKYYYVPNANTRLLSPQKLLDKCNG